MIQDLRFINKRTYGRFFFTVGIVALIFFGSVSHAATPQLGIHASADRVAPESEITVTVLLSTDRAINAADVLFGYNPDVLEFDGFDDSESLIDAWKTRPVVVELGIIGFIGGMQKPFQGEGGILMRLHFRSKMNGEARIGIASGLLYGADGYGTEYATTPFFARLIVDSTAPQVSRVREEDTSPPVLTLSPLELGPREEEGLVLSIDAVDEDSGIQKIEAREKRWFFWGPWREAQNPIRISRGAWVVELRAMNNAELSAAQIYFVFGEFTKKALLGVGIVFLFACFILFRRRMRKSKGL